MKKIILSSVVRMVMALGAMLSMRAMEVEGELLAERIYRESTIYDLAYLGNPSVLQKKLDETNEDVHARGELNRTVLHYAALGGSFDMVRMLIDQYGLNPAQEDALKRTPLHYAVIGVCRKKGIGDYQAIVEFLVSKHGSDRNLKDAYNVSPFEIAAAQERKDLFAFLDVEGDASVGTASLDHAIPMTFETGSDVSPISNGAAQLESKR